MGRISATGAPSVVISTRVGPRTLELLDKDRGLVSRARWLDSAIMRALGMTSGEDGIAFPEPDPFVPPRGDGVTRLHPPVTGDIEADHPHIPGRPAVSRSLPGGGMLTRYYCEHYPDCMWTSDWG